MTSSSSSWLSSILLCTAKPTPSSSSFSKPFPTFRTVHSSTSTPKQLPLLNFRFQETKNRKTASSFTCFLYKNEEQEVEVEGKEDCPIFARWDVPWGWSTIVLTTMACGVGVAVTGIVGATTLHYLGLEGRALSLDEKAELLLVGQLSITAVVLGVIYGITSTVQPLPDDIFHYDWKEPFNRRDGWLLWAGIGLFGALASTSLADFVLSILNGQNSQSEVDILAPLSPLVAYSSVSAACLIFATGVLAPILEETVFRGFLMVSLTKWLPTPASVLLTAALFAIGHLNPEELPQLFLSGAALGFSYAQTRNMLTPITIHALWNTGVTLLTFLQVHGYEISDS